MPKPQPSKEEYIAMRLAKEKGRAEKDWEKRGKIKMGRPPHYEANKKAIVKLVETNAGVSDPEFDLWTLDKWVKEVGKRKGEQNPPPATIKKDLKKLFSRNLIPMNLRPAQMIQAMPRETRFEYLFGMAIAKAGIEAMVKTGLTKISFSTVNEIHRRLCEKHLWTMKRLPEADRRAWCERKFRGLVTVPIESLKPKTAIPRRSKTR